MYRLKKFPEFKLNYTNFPILPKLPILPSLVKTKKALNVLKLKF